MLSRPLASRALSTTLLHVLGREELALLDVDRLAGRGDRVDEIGLAAEERRRLQHVDDRGDLGDFVFGVHVGQHRHADLPLDLGEDAQALLHADAAKRLATSCDWPCRTTT